MPAARRHFSLRRLATLLACLATFILVVTAVLLSTLQTGIAGAVTTLAYVIIGVLVVCSKLLVVESDGRVTPY